MPSEDQLATHCQLPMLQYPTPGGGGVGRDIQGYIDFGTSVGGRLHLGDDVGGPGGTPVFAVAHGVWKYSEEHGSAVAGNWGWVGISEHTFRNGRTVCVVYGHAQPVLGILPGTFVPIGTQVAVIADYETAEGTWANHLHFAIHDGPFAAPLGTYPPWLAGYATPDKFPGGFIDPYAFCVEHAAHASADQVPGPGAARPILSNLPFEGEGIFPLGDEDWFAFSGTAGQRVFLSVARESGDLIPQMALFTSTDGIHPVTKVIGADVAGASAFFSASPWRVALANFPLPQTGKYLVKIRGQDGTTGFYRFAKTVM